MLVGIYGALATVEQCYDVDEDYEDHDDVACVAYAHDRETQTIYMYYTFPSVLYEYLCYMYMYVVIRAWAHISHVGLCVVRKQWPTSTTHFVEMYSCWDKVVCADGEGSWVGQYGGVGI